MHARIPSGGGARPVRVLCIGDSLTSVYPNTPYDHYPRYLAENLPWSGRLSTVGSVNMGTYRTEGHSGYATDQILSGLSGWAATYWQPPTHVAILLGVNDEIVSALTSDETITNLGTLQDECLTRWPRARVTISTLLPAGSTGTGATRVDWIAEVNPKMRTAGFNDLLDLNANAGLDPDVHLVSDKLHTNTAGAQLIAPFWLEHWGLA